MITCPLCNKALQERPSSGPITEEAINLLVEQHIESGCRNAVAGQGLRVHSCTKCSASLLMPIICPQCHQGFCPDHRHASSHSCPAAGKPASSQSAAEQRKQEARERLRKATGGRRLGSASETGSKGAGSSSSASSNAKTSLTPIEGYTVQASNTKSTAATATPNLEPEDAVLVLMVFPRDSGKLARYIKLPRYWSMGRLLDFGTSQAGIRNQNNVRGARHLCLFDPQTGEILSTSSKVEDCDSVMQAGLVVVEYEDVAQTMTEELLHRVAKAMKNSHKGRKRCVTM